MRLNEDPKRWLAQMPPLDALPPAMRLQCRVWIATLQPTSQAHLAALTQQLSGTGMRCLQRSLAMAAARHALNDGLPAQACVHAQRALELAGCVDTWIDDPASVLLVAADAFEADGERSDAARECASIGAAWVRARASIWQDEGQRSAWCDLQPVHRALLKWGELAADGRVDRNGIDTPVRRR